MQPWKYLTFKSTFNLPTHFHNYLSYWLLHKGPGGRGGEKSYCYYSVLIVKVKEAARFLWGPLVSYGEARLRAQYWLKQTQAEKISDDWLENYPSIFLSLGFSFELDMNLNKWENTAFIQNWKSRVLKFILAWKHRSNRKIRNPYAHCHSQ